MERIIGKGAEAVLILDEWYGFKVVRKIRIRKRYRHPLMDLWLRQERTRIEARVMAEVKKLGIHCPTLLDVNLDKFEIIMDFIPGSKLSDIIDSLSINILNKIFTNIGKYLAIMHEHGLVHGDLTTSNIILTAKGSPYIIDFGLSGFSRSLEDYGVDVHLFKRSLESTHYKLVDTLFTKFMEGYSKVRGEKKAYQVINKMKEIRRRGRYVEKS